MAHERYTRTNQKVFFAGLALEAWKRELKAPSVNSQAIIQAEREAALFHLHGALLGLCHEVAGYYRMAVADAPRIELILTDEQMQAAPSPELAELIELARQPETWVARLSSAYAALFQPPQAPAKAKVDPALPMIEAITLDEVEPLGLDEIESWRQAFKQLALRFREGMTEW